MLILFDVNGTLLDSSALKHPIRNIFGRKVSVDDWFTKVLQHAAASTLSDDYRPFGDLAIAVLQMTRPYESWPFGACAGIASRQGRAVAFPWRSAPLKSAVGS